ncbi:MAG TPA: acetyl-CoA carboxylase biotin carboxyl carrier protein subunit [Bryobacteraceae bacterium]
MKRDTRIRGRAGSIEIEAESFQYQHAGGEPIKGRFFSEPTEPGSRAVVIDGRVYRVTRGARGEMLVNGVATLIEVFDPRDLRARPAAMASGGRSEIFARMPGKVVRVLVSKGDSVEAGQGLVVVEAMKMQNEMKSPKAGRVAEVRTQPGAAVLAGETLIVVE